jgi:hypothetical protein
MGKVDGLGGGKEVGGVCKSSPKKMGSRMARQKEKEKKGMGEKTMITREKNEKKKGLVKKRQKEILTK